jgi:hypothetical protein
MRKLLLLFIACALPSFGQANRGELQLAVTDPSGLGMKAEVHLASQANQYSNDLMTNAEGHLVAEHLPYGIYRLEIKQAGFAEVSNSLEIRSSIPMRYTITLKLSSVQQSVTVKTGETLLDPDQAGSVDQIGADRIRGRLGSLPGRSLQDLANSEPGWLYEGNAVLHPRGSEYQTQFVIDGIPLTDNRSPSFGPEIEADDVQSMSIYTAGIPAEYGRKMGGVIEVNTLEDAQPGFHGQAILSGGSFDTAGAFAQGQYVWGNNSLGGSASGSRTDHYLNPVVPQNFSNTGTAGDFSMDYRRSLTANDKFGVIVRHEIAHYDIPNEMVQQAAGQRQTSSNIETMGSAFYQHFFSANASGDLRGMVRDNASDFQSNPLSTPIEVFQHNSFREGYFKGSVTVDHGHHEWKAGVESDNTFLHENFNYNVTDPTQFDDGTPLTFSYQGTRPDLEHLHQWTIAAGLRWDHYQLLLNKSALEPRLAISRFFPAADLVVHFSYDRVFQTPSFENILLSSSTQVESLDPANFFRLPVKPSEGNYYELGLTKVLWKQVRFGANYYRRDVNNYADDDQISNTAISFPIAFRKSIIYGAEGKIEVPDWHRFSGFASYSYTLGNAWFPVTGGLFLGDDASNAASQLGGHFPDSQDQRNTIRGRARYQLTRRAWIAGGVQFDSGLPFEFDGDPDTVLAQYGQGVLNRINFDRGRIDPTFQVNASAGADLYTSDRMKIHMQVDGQNLNNVLDVIDFGGLFSGNAIGPSRSVALRFATAF